MVRVRNGGVDFFKLDLFILLPCGGERNQRGVRLACPWVDGWSRGVACMIRGISVVRRWWPWHSRQMCRKEHVAELHTCELKRTQMGAAGEESDLWDADGGL